MQLYHDQETTFHDLPCARPFRFHHRGEAAIGLKVVFGHGQREEAALVLTTTKAGLQPGNLISAYEVGNAVVELNGVTLAPSIAPESVTAGAGNFAQPGEIELHDGNLIFVTTPQDRSPMRVNLKSGTIGYSTGKRPAEIYSAWSIVRKHGEQLETLYEHKPMPAEPIIVQVD
jgi:hypothetical protein